MKTTMSFILNFVITKLYYLCDIIVSILKYLPLLGDINAVEAFLWAKNYALLHCTIIIVGIHPNLTS